MNLGSKKTSLKIYCIAIGGTGMAPLACLLKQQGHEVLGSDGPLYPPMSDLLAAQGITPFVGFDAERLRTPADDGSRPRPEFDLIIVGNAVPRSHVEAVAAEASGVERISMPQAIARFLLPGRQSLVVAGTHGKTTTTSMAAWVYSELGTDPGYLIGGWPIGLSGSFRLGEGERFLLEGDEYNAAYFDRGAKFLHYRPETVLLTSVEWDHADLYPDAVSFRAAFEKLIALLPASGHLVACTDEPEVARLAEASPCRVTRYGERPAADVRIENLRSDSSGMAFDLVGPSPLLEGREVALRLGVWGVHNAANAAAVWCAARRDGFPHDGIARALAGFRGVRRRLEEIGRVGDVVVVDDFAHHPTEVSKSIDGLRQRYPSRRVLVVFEPRSLSAGRALLHQDYLRAFADADLVALAPVFHAGRIAAEQRLDLDRLCADLTGSGIVAWTDGVPDIERRILDEARPGDVLATMSSGSFEGLPRKLLEGLRKKNRSNLEQDP
jgi:UDP-N-acetylmuramate: L-alanyl-gamma-D-glutamyl-meso-diaminopimelate ligase